jgi:ATP-dependent helicase HrpA
VTALGRDLETAVNMRRWKAEHRPAPALDADLPVIARQREIAEAIAEHQVIVICGETGSGKSTQLPQIALGLGRGVDGMIAHTQPRRIAARSLAARVAEELHTEVGEAVGYKVRFTDRVSERSYIKLLTDGMLLAEIQSDPDLCAYDTIIVDEAHERSLNIDFLLGYLKRLLPRRPELKLIITSATIDPQRFAHHFDDAPVIEVSGRTYPVEVRYRPLGGDEDDFDRDQPQAIVDAVAELLDHRSWIEVAPDRGDAVLVDLDHVSPREFDRLLRRGELLDRPTLGPPHRPLEENDALHGRSQTLDLEG